ncbi:MAG TPA: hypothetical protein ENK46_01325 [Flavobacteriia bacterium]|jgi:hypothetical protein|nr:hypothetical protein [Flavobacteriia bacterium]
MNEKKKIQRVKKSDLVPDDIAKLYQDDVLEKLKEKVKKDKKSNEKKSKKLRQHYGQLKIIRFS